MNIAKENGLPPLWEIHYNVETTFEVTNVEPLVESHVHQHVKPNVETYFPSYEPEVKGKINVEADENDDIPISNILKMIVKGVTEASREYYRKGVVSFNEETKTDEESAVKLMRSIVMFMADGVKENKKYVPPKTSLRTSLNYEDGNSSKNSRE
ncbi:unnamed protein product [Vicia faba]|uniref:Uncharacterized protein n=1 Tax=Vicia faba TaxID=3906 RepID=A0AAV0ZAA9_VICFA|nr:unnamed protein product [Vicia faba]